MDADVLRVCRQSRGNRIVIKFIGPFLAQTYHTFVHYGGEVHYGYWEKRIAEGETFSLDLSEVSAVDAAGMGALLHFTQIWWRFRDQPLRIVAVTPTVRRDIEMLQMAHFYVFED